MKFGKTKFFFAQILHKGDVFLIMNLILDDGPTSD